MDKYITIEGERFKKDSCNYYFNAQHIYLELSNKERCFFDFLCEKMDDSNRVLIDASLKLSYKEFIKLITSDKIKISIRSLDRFTIKINDSKLILKVANTKLYYVNPKYASRLSNLKRAKLIKKLLLGNKLTEEEKNKLRSTSVI